MTIRNSSSACSSPFRLASTLFSAAVEHQRRLVDVLGDLLADEPLGLDRPVELRLGRLERVLSQNPSKSGSVTTTPTEYPSELSPPIEPSACDSQARFFIQAQSYM